ncbi:hypothetical protein VNO78_20340 [Psophocarpus tetragonolobus]|uniref:Uncharacterized protein n=1 Tax=Psophocarpus tetragonolobus TaxID=3891 RepID=A0AAN9S9R6_PSOTE
MYNLKNIESHWLDFIKFRYANHISVLKKKRNHCLVDEKRRQRDEPCLYSELIVDSIQSGSSPSSFPELNAPSFSLSQVLRISLFHLNLFKTSTNIVCI